MQNDICQNKNNQCNKTINNGDNKNDNTNNCNIDNDNNNVYENGWKLRY